ncbi:hypothetical protein CAC42_6453 [Sphaceloma murrayae]|uniref:DNA repair protein rhp42 n=1 Tax=Sphaceloma murrayae TaxID=2082308 RepID=A0A2K1QMG7_9PEZI|nr:hypothetical protein CAC42_6453 [Sphaceloma murrayae]
MPPRSNRKRKATPEALPVSKRARNQTRSKSSVFDTVDSTTRKIATPEETRDYLKTLEDSDESSDDEDEHDFEDVPGVVDSTTAAAYAPHASDDEKEMDWEDAIGAESEKDTLVTAPTEDVEIGDVTVTLSVDGKYATAADKAATTLRKGPSKRERAVRNGTHCIHVQSLMWHNAVRNSWLNDQELQDNLIKSLPEGIRVEINKWREDMGMQGDDPRLKVQKKKMKTKAAKQKATEKRAGRDWDVDAERQDKGAINLSRGDPTLRMLKVLAAYWRKRFTIVAPGLRKLGYMPLKRLTTEINAWKKDKKDHSRHGERIETIQDFRNLGRACEGSRDVGSQLFTALLRGIGLEARMVANLQPAGIGWGKIEEAKSLRDTTKSDPKMSISGESDSDAPDKLVKQAGKQPKPTKKALTPKQAGTVSKTKTEIKSRNSTGNKSSTVINLETDEESTLSSAPSDLEDDRSIVDVTETFVKRRPNKKFDRDMHYPNYWTEVLSPISKTFVPVDPLVLSTIATNGELLATFEPRGKRADQAKQVICYTVAHSRDGSAKDVTVRYLKKHQLPGRTKGYRMPVEKIKVYNRKGKVRKYEEYDWFKTVMSVFNRPAHLRTEIDELEESTDLKPFKPEIEKAKAEVESLQWYKQSAEFVLERHLRREEAIPPGASPVKTFKAGKGDKAEDEPVYLRSDVLNCKTAESWHKEGREIKLGEQPMKLVPMRAVTTMRKREMEEVERETGEKAKQGLFARDQTDWIIPPPIGEDREIPRNAFGNIDVYVPSMVPKGAVHLPLKGTGRICRDLKISYAEAVTGFEFGKRMAIPIITGVVVPEEHEKEVRAIWKEKEIEKKKKEDDKRTQLCLSLWRKFFSGLRIVERMKREYADTGREEDVNPFVRKARLQDETRERMSKDIQAETMDSDAAGGGFLLPGEDDGEDDGITTQSSTIDVDIESGGFVLDDAEQDPKSEDLSFAAAPITPTSMQASHAMIEHSPLPNGHSSVSVSAVDTEYEKVDSEAVATVSRTSNGASRPSRSVRRTPYRARNKLDSSSHEFSSGDDKSKDIEYDNDDSDMESKKASGTISHSKRASAIKARTKLLEASDGSENQDEDDSDAVEGTSGGRNVSRGKVMGTGNVRTKTAAGRERKKTSPTKSQYFGGSGRTRSTRKPA